MPFLHNQWRLKSAAGSKPAFCYHSSKVLKHHCCHTDMSSLGLQSPNEIIWTWEKLQELPSQLSNHFLCNVTSLTSILCIMLVASCQVTFSFLTTHMLLLYLFMPFAGSRHKLFRPTNHSLLRYVRLFRPSRHPVSLQATLICMLQTFNGSTGCSPLHGVVLTNFSSIIIHPHLSMFPGVILLLTLCL